MRPTAGCNSAINGTELTLHSIDSQTSAASSLSVHVQIYGSVPTGQALTRAAAQVGDWIMLSGAPGEAAAGLDRIVDNNVSAESELPQVKYLIHRLQFPTPRVELGIALRGVAHACIDVSDGLIADLDHICEQSHCAASVQLSSLPVSDTLRQVTGEEAEDYVLCGGDDYELCFTVAETKLAMIDAIAEQYSVRISPIGRIVSGQGVRVYDNNNSVYTSARQDFVHFND